MLFCTINFIEFLSVTFFLYLLVIFLQNRFPLNLNLNIKGFKISLSYVTVSVVLLSLSSVYFYNAWKKDYIWLLIASIVINFIFGKFIEKRNKYHKTLTVLAVLFNVGLLAYFKYTFFLLDNIQLLFNVEFTLDRIILPLGISFFTFQQIAYIVDIYKGEGKSSTFFKYFLFVSFFPQLIAGPIVHHKSIIPQFDNINDSSKLLDNVKSGLSRFSIGLFKKLAIADTLSYYVSYGYSMDNELDMAVVATATLAYTFQIYYDFSGYCDMAVGVARFFNISIPENFDSPYKSLSIKEFWRRWHITLSTWLKVYIYIPLGGNRKGEFFTFVNVFLTFLIGGLWHGAGWTFVIWGALHGLASVIHTLWSEHFKMNRYIAWFITFTFINFSLIFFRADSVNQAKKMISALVILPKQSFETYIPVILVFSIIILFTVLLPNSRAFQLSVEKSTSFAKTAFLSIACSVMALIALFFMLAGTTPNFLYFNF